MPDDTPAPPAWMTTWRIVAAATAALVLALAVFAAANPTAFDLRGAVFASALAFALLAVGVLYAVVAARPLGVPRAAPRAAPEPAREEPRRERAPAPRREPFGDVHPVVDVEGIGPTHAAGLKRQGITDTRQLWLADAQQVAAGLGLAAPIVRDWQAMAELMAVRGIGKQYAEALVRAGVRSIGELRGWEPAELAEAVAEAGEGRSHRIQKNPVTEKVAANWVEAARAHAA